MRLFLWNRKFGAVEVTAMCVEAFNAGGPTKLAPSLKRAKAIDSDGILGCLDLKNSGLSYLTENEGEWSFLLLISDGVSSNRAAAKKILTLVNF